MHYFIFNFLDGEGRSTTVIFDPSKEFLLSRMEEALKAFHTYNEQCVNTIYIYPACRVEHENNLIKAIAAISNKTESFITAKKFSKEGLSIDYIAKQIFYEGLLKIIKSRNALLESDDNYHYILPSKKHSPFFIRTGNILVRSCEINFIALYLMSMVDISKFSYIVCDTSSILQIPYALSHLASLFGINLNVPFVSFGSYSSFDEYTFRPNSLVLISASNSGELEKKVRKKQKDLHVITILYNNVDQSRCLFNLHPVLNQLLTTKKTSQFKTHLDCEYCQKNSIPVVVGGEQFIPSKLVIQKVLFKKSHVPSWVNSFAKYVVEKRAIFVNRSENVTAKRREIFIDLSILLESNDGFLKCLNRYIENFLPSGISHLIF